MLKLNLPIFDIKVTKKNNELFVFDRLRKKHLVLTPEEWVRQHFVNYLIEKKGYPSGLIANEMAIELNGQKKRCDSVVFGRMGEPLVIVEYKAPDIKISQNVFDQIARYNFVLKVNYLMMSNGIDHYCCKVDYEKQQIFYLNEIPSYETLIQ